MILTESQVGSMLTGNTKIAMWTKVLNDVLPNNGIDTIERIAAFMAQTAHESMNYKTTVENLNYSTNGLMATWPARFKTVEFANQYARNAEKIANYVYAGRMGNHKEPAIGDGWKYRGRGIIMITGKDNYRKFSMFKYNDERLVDDPTEVANPPLSLESACWFWNTHSLNALADNGDIAGISKIINGGTIGLAERTKKFNEYKALLC